MRLFFFLLVFSVQVTAAEKKDWSTLADCRYVSHKNNDGDSFHVRCGADEFALNGPFTVITRKAYAQGAARDPRYYGTVTVNANGKDTGLDEMLVLAGLARVKGVSVNIPGAEKARAHSRRLLLLEEHAKEKRRGLWASSRSHR